MSVMSRSLPLTPDRTAQAPRNRGMGVMFLAFFGSWWLSLGGRALGAPAVLFLALAVPGGALFLAGLRQARRAGGAAGGVDAAALASRSRSFRVINIVQWSAIIALIVLLNLLQQSAWITPGIMLIVGLHFFPLARLFHARGHALIGIALCAVALSYPWLAAGPQGPAGPLAAGLILWTAALVWALRRG